MEGQAHRRSGAACILGIGEIRGADAPLPHAGVFGKGKRVSPGQDEIRGSCGGRPAPPEVTVGGTHVPLKLL